MATIDVDSLQVFSSAEMLKLTRYAIAQILAGVQSYAINGRMFTKADLGKLAEMERAYEQKVADEAAGANGGGNVLVSFGRS